MPDSLREALTHIADATPFLGVVENLIAVVLGGAFMAFVALQVLESKFDDFKTNISGQVEKIDTKMEQMYRDIYRPSLGNVDNGRPGG